MDRSSKALAVGGALLLLNSAYLGAFATPSLFYFANVAFHVLGGAALLVLGLAWLLRRARRLSLAGIAAAILLAAGAALGVALAITGATTRYYWLLK